MLPPIPTASTDYPSPDKLQPSKLPTCTKKKATMCNIASFSTTSCSLHQNVIQSKHQRSNSNFQRNSPSLKRQPLHSGRSNSASPFSSPFSSSSSLTKNNSSGNDLSGYHNHHYHGTSAHNASLMANRSGKEAVKEYLAAINDICDEQDRRSASPYLPAPIEKCTALAFWSSDAYYAIVISKNGGIATIVRAMKTYLDINDSDVEDFCERGRRSRKVHSNASRFQACCARILLGLCQVSPLLKRSVIDAGGREIVLAAIQKFPRSFDVSTMDALLKDTPTSDCERVRQVATLKVPTSTAETKEDEDCKGVKKEKLPSAKQRRKKPFGDH
ncbi:hypothetical protein IV203_007831 [Nitzschia inconspicua]|uniref:Uncharacterized protein n=1 Tax=Nitzschia inconspicua TaxID=303405 RepID=A0A9K3KYZ3_9STRA|nr:hypothetical protein IV203_007831 [Nitzschia inconspicua]